MFGTRCLATRRHCPMMTTINWLSKLYFLLNLILGVYGSGLPAPQPLFKHLEPNLDAAVGLVCFQCHSVSNEQVPICDKSIFRLATPEERLNMTLQCPHYQGRC